MRRSATLRGVDDLTDDDLSLFDQFRAKAREFANALNALKSRSAVARSLTPTEKAKYDSLVSRGDLIQKTVGGVTSTIDGILAWLRGTFGLGSVGALPVVIPYAVIGAALAAMGYFINDAVVMLRKLDLVEQGKLDPSDLDAGSISSGIGSVVSKVTLALIVGGALWLVWNSNKGGR